MEKTGYELLKILAKDLTIRSTITLLAKEIGLTRVGLWKALKKLEKEGIITLFRIGGGKTGIYEAGLNWNNPVTKKRLALVLTEESMGQQRWLSDFTEIGGRVDFLLIYGSIVHSPKEAGDIDLLGVVSDKKQFVEIDKALIKIQKTQAKKIHALFFTSAELKREIHNHNKAFLDAIKKGYVLFGHENFIDFIISVTSSPP